MRLTNVGLRITTPDCLLSKRGYVEHECERTRVTGIKDGKCVLQVYLGSCGGGGKMEDELVIVCKEAAFEPLGWFLNKMAKGGEVTYNLPKTHFENLDFSFSGIKTAVINLNHKTPNINKENLCASFEAAVTEVLMQNTKKAIEQTGVKQLVLAGGVSANSYIRDAMKSLEKENIKVYMPDLKLCTDNAAMIASAGYYNFIKGKTSDLYLNAVPNLKIN